MNKDQLRILCSSVSAPGHTNPIIGIATLLAQRGHSIVFATERSWETKFTKLGFEEEVYDEKPKEDDKPWLSFVESIKSGFREDRFVGIERSMAAFKAFTKTIKFTDERMKEIIEVTKPDVILYEQMLWHPSVISSGIPVVQLEAANPLSTLGCDQLPPATFGLSIHSDPTTWIPYKKRREDLIEAAMVEYNELLKSKGLPTVKRGQFRFVSSNLNILMYPRILAKDYIERLSPEKAKYFITIDHSLRPSDRHFTLPEELKVLPGRLVYLSMGSLGSSDFELMEILVNALGKTGPKYKFIVSTGMLHEKYKLAQNMWGQPYLPQLGVLPMVDLAIIHGGNNTFVETLYFGKPMIVVPLFADQADNAQRAVDTKIGARFHPFKEPADKLIQLIDHVLNDAEISVNVAKISKDMQESSTLELALNQIEFVARHPKTPTVVTAF